MPTVNGFHLLVTIVIIISFHAIISLVLDTLVYLKN